MQKHLFFTACNACDQKPTESNASDVHRRLLFTVGISLVLGEALR